MRRVRGERMLKRKGKSGEKRKGRVERTVRGERMVNVRGWKVRGKEGRGGEWESEGTKRGKSEGKVGRDKSEGNREAVCWRWRGE